MRTSLVARFVSHPSIDFVSSRRSARTSYFVRRSSRTVYHRPRRSMSLPLKVAALRSKTSLFRFPSVGRLGNVPARRATSPFGLPRARRA